MKSRRSSGAIETPAILLPPRAPLMKVIFIAFFDWEAHIPGTMQVCSAFNTRFSTTYFLVIKGSIYSSLFQIILIGAIPCSKALSRLPMTAPSLPLKQGE